MLLTINQMHIQIAAPAHLKTKTTIDKAKRLIVVSSERLKSRYGQKSGEGVTSLCCVAKKGRGYMYL